MGRETPPMSGVGLTAEEKLLLTDLTDGGIGTLIYKDINGEYIDISNGTPGQALRSNGPLQTPSFEDVNEITQDEKDAIVANTAKVSYPASDASKVSNLPNDQSAINSDFEARVALNDAKVGITPTQAGNIRTLEELQDAVGAMFQGGTQTGGTVVYDDTNGVFNVTITGGGGTPLTKEDVEDFVNGVTVGGKGINIVYDDANNSLTFALSGESFTTAEKNKLGAYPNFTTLNATLNDKVDKVAGKGLSTNDFTNILKDKLDNVPTDQNTINADIEARTALNDAKTSGEVNTATNVGDGEDIFKQKSGTDLEFRGIKGKNSSVVVTTNGENIEIEATGGGVKNNVATTTPTVSDDNTQGYEPLSRWLDTTTNTVYVMVKDDTGAAVWKKPETIDRYYTRWYLQQ